MNSEKLLINPVRLRIMQYLSIHETATTLELIEFLSDISRASVYNHMKQLESHGAIYVVQENRIRGTVEKVFGVNQSDNEVQSVLNYMVSMMANFQKYFESEDYDTKRDMLFVDHSLLYLSDEEFTRFFTEYTELCKKYFNYSPDESRKGRNLSLISSPKFDIED